MYGDIKITLLKLDTLSEYTVRTFALERVSPTILYLHIFDIESVYVDDQYHMDFTCTGQIPAITKYLSLILFLFGFLMASLLKYTMMALFLHPAFPGSIL